MPWPSKQLPIISISLPGMNNEIHNYVVHKKCVIDKGDIECTPGYANRNPYSCEKKPPVYAELTRGLDKDKILQLSILKARDLFKNKHPIYSHQKRQFKVTFLHCHSNQRMNRMTSQCIKSGHFHRWLNTYPFFSIHSPISNPCVTELFHHPFP